MTLSKRSPRLGRLLEHDAISVRRNHGRDARVIKLPLSASRQAGRSPSWTTELIPDEAVAASDAALAQGEVLEHGQYEGAPVSLVQEPGSSGYPALEVKLLQPVRHQITEQAVWRQVGVGGLGLRALAELCFERLFRRLDRVTCGLHDARATVPVAEPRARLDAA